MFSFPLLQTLSLGTNTSFPLPLPLPSAQNLSLARCSYPAQFFSKWVLPKTRYSFACTIKDERISFALNVGSMSNPSSIPIYDQHRLNSQLDLVTKYFLQETVIVAADKSGKGRGVKVTLPTVQSWYANDFGKGRQIDLVSFAHSYLSGEKHTLLTLALEESNRNSINVRFAPFLWTCRSLTSLDEGLLETLLAK